MARYSLADVKNIVLDLIFPRYCLGCKKELSIKQVSHLCETCFNLIYINPAPQCCICHQRNIDARTCQKCRSKTALCGFLAAGRYEDKILRETIHYLKYNFLESLSKPLAEIALRFIKQNQLESIFENAILVPVPLTHRRLAKRGFNQSELIAQKINDCLNGAKLRNDLIKRTRFTKPQADIRDPKERKRNIENSFEVKNSSAIFELVNQNNKFILIDDVSTSGATLEECAKTLKTAGAKEIWALVIARG